MQQKYTIIFFLLGLYGTAQSNRLHFQNIHVNGRDFKLKTNIVFEDSFGYFWLGTNNGLYRYDGHNLKEYQYDVFNENSLPNNSINSIVEDDYQNLWIGTESYLVHFERKKNSFSRFYKNTTAQILGKSKDGAIWAHLWRIGLVRIPPNGKIDSLKFQTKFNYKTSNTLLRGSTRINDLFEDSFGRLWFGTSKGILTLDKNGILGTTDFHREALLIKPYDDNSFLVATNENIYVLAYRKENRDLEVLEGHRNKIQNTNIGFKPNDVTKDPKGTELWIATNKGLIKGVKNNNRYDFELFKAGSGYGSLMSNQLNSVVLDKFGNLWIGSAKGVNKHWERTSIFEYYPITVDNTVINTIFLDRTGKVWTGTSKGEIRGGLEKQDISVKKISTVNEVRVLKYDYNREEIYVGVNNVLQKSQGFHDNGPTVFKTIKAYERTVKDLLPINNNELWIGLWSGGIDIINEVTPISTFKQGLIKKLRHHNVSTLHLSQNGMLWIGTRGQGVYKIDLNNETFQHFLPSLSNGLTSDAVLCFLETQGKLYIGTRGGGINMYDPKNDKFYSFGKAQGILSTTIAGMRADSDGNIWASTQNGLTRFDIDTKKFVNFGTEDGLQENQFIFNSSTVLPNGTILFGFSNGIYKVKSTGYKKNNLLAKTLITNFEVLGSTKKINNTSITTKPKYETIVPDQDIILPHDNNNIWVEFTSLDLTAPNKNEFAYMLEGVNDYWIHTSASNHNANFNDLQPGSYTFKVKSTNSDGVWNDDPATLSFKINPPFWKSNTAILFYWISGILGLIAGITLMRRWYRMKKNLVAETISRQKDNEHNRMKMVFFTDISHELRTPLTLIQGTVEKVINRGQFQLLPQTAKRIHNNALRMGRLINQIMDIRKFDVGAFKIKVSKNDIVEETLNLKNAFNDFAEIYEIDYNFNCDEKKITAYYDSQILEKILFNLLSNAFKYTSGKGKVDIFLKSVQLNQARAANKDLRPGNYIKCTVRDNGVGISKENLAYIFDRYYQSTKLPKNQVPGTGIGMELVHKLIQVHHGNISVESEENVYTQFTFLLPIQKKHYKEDEFLSEKATKEPSIITKSEYQVFEEVTSEGLHKVESSLKSKILLVEDNHELRKMMKEELSEEFFVIEASNGQEGYRKAKEEQPKLIISDILMPIEDGVFLLRNLKNNKETAHIPVFMLTAKDSHEVKMECLKIGASDYIEKPFSPEFVKWKVKNMLGSRKDLKDKYSKVISVNTSEVDLESNDEKLIKKLIQIVEKSLEDNSLSVEFLASEVGMSRANLYRKLQSIINDTPVNFIKQIRLKRACHLLQKNQMYISEVAYMTGFSNHKYFSKCFSREYGMSPTEYAKQFEKKNKDRFRSDLVEMIGKMN